jgi:hypothetical protein
VLRPGVDPAVSWAGLGRLELPSLPETIVTQLVTHRRWPRVIRDHLIRRDLRAAFGNAHLTAR